MSSELLYGLVGPPVNMKRLVGRAAARRGHKLMVRKTHPTKNFSEQFLMGFWPTRKL